MILYSPAKETRIGISVGKKHGNSVVRNRVKRLLRAAVREEIIRAAGLPASLSNTAGTFVCNQLMYGLLYHLSREFPGMRGGFIHVPCIPEQAARAEKPVPSLPLPEIVRGLEAALSVLADA